MKGDCRGEDVCSVQHTRSVRCCCHGGVNQPVCRTCFSISPTPTPTPTSHAEFQPHVQSMHLPSRYPLSHIHTQMLTYKKQTQHANRQTHLHISGLKGLCCVNNTLHFLLPKSEVYIYVTFLLVLLSSLFSLVS